MVDVVNSVNLENRKLSPEMYARFNELVEGCCGLHFPEKRAADLARGILQGFSASTCQDLREYYERLRDPVAGLPLLQQLVNILTVSESHFFRDEGQFDVLWYQILPELIEQHRSSQSLHIWSAGCAGGEEPYSIAIVLRELLPDVDQWSIRVFGTDINAEVITRAQKGVYSAWAFREARAQQLRLRYFQEVGGYYLIKPEVRDMVEFEHLNLVKDAYPLSRSAADGLDLILCRNVMIYFNLKRRQEVVDRLYETLTPGGWLAVGAAEHSLDVYRSFQTHIYQHTILYQRPDYEAQAVNTSVEVNQLARSIKDNSAQGRIFEPTPTPPLPVEAPVPTDKVLDTVIITLNAAKVNRVLQKARENLDYGLSTQARDLLLQTLGHAGALRNAMACTLLGRAYANLGSWREAESWCRRAVTLDKLALDAYYTLALVLQHQGKLVDALSAMKKVIYINRTYVMGHFNLAELYYQNGQLELALKTLDNARRLLDGYKETAVISGSGGITANSLKTTIHRQLKQWQFQISSADVTDVKG